MLARRVPPPWCCKAHAPIKAGLSLSSTPPPRPRRNITSSSTGTGSAGSSSSSTSSRQEPPKPQLHRPARPGQPHKPTPPTHAPGGPAKHAPTPDVLEPAPPGIARQRPVPPSVAMPASPSVSSPQSAGTTVIVTSSGNSSRGSPTDRKQGWTPQQRKLAALIDELQAATGSRGRQTVNTQALIKLYQDINAALQEQRQGFHPRTLVKYVSSLDKASQARRISKDQLQLQSQAVIANVLATGVKGFSLVGLSVLLHSLARMGCRGYDMQQLMQMAMQHLQQLGTAPWLDRSSEAWKPMTPALTMWAFGTAGFEGDASPMVAVVNATVAEGLMQNAEIQAWCELLVGAAKLGVPWQDMEQAWNQGAAALEKAATLSCIQPQQLCNLAWACATAGYTCHGQLDRLGAAFKAAVAGGVMDRATNQNWANLFWAAAKLDVPWSDCVTAGLNAAVAGGLMDTSTSQNWATLLLAAAKLGIPWQDMEKAWDLGIKAMEHAAQKAALNSQDLANILFACAIVEYKKQGAPGRLAACCTVALKGGVMRDATPQGWTTILWSTSQLGVPADSIMTVWQAAVPAVGLAISKGTCSQASLNMAFEAAAKHHHSQAITAWLPAAEVSMEKHRLLQDAGPTELAQTLAVLAQIDAVAGQMQANNKSVRRMAHKCADLLAQHAQRGHVGKAMHGRAVASLTSMHIKHPAFTADSITQPCGQY